jgi:hypothetical protein
MPFDAVFSFNQSVLLLLLKKPEHAADVYCPCEVTWDSPRPVLLSKCDVMEHWTDGKHELQNSPRNVPARLFVKAQDWNGNLVVARNITDKTVGTKRKLFRKFEKPGTVLRRDYFLAERREVYHVISWINLFLIPNFIMQRTQSKILRATANSSRYVTNHTLHSDL